MSTTTPQGVGEAPTSKSTAGVSPAVSDETAKFLARLDPRPDARFTFQTLDDNSERDDKRLVKILHGTLEEHAAELSRSNNLGAGVFVTVNETNLRGRKAEHILRIRGVFLDLDNAPLEPVQACDPPPHMIVKTSPGKWHAYWLVDGLALEDFSAVQKALAARFNGDRSVSDLPRIMRLPGFKHCKGDPHLVRIVDESDHDNYSAEEILGAFLTNTEDQVTAPKRKSRKEPAFELPETIPEGERNVTLYKYGCSLRAKGWGDDDELGKELRRVNADRCKPPLQDREVADIIREVCKQPVGASKKRAGPTPAEKLLEYVNECELFHADDRRTYVSFKVSGHIETHETTSEWFESWLNRCYWKDRNMPISQVALKQAVDTATAKARFDGELEEVWLRVAQDGEKIYLDLGDDTWRVVEIDVKGWRVRENSPVKFRRGGGTALPEPVRSGDIEELRSFLNITYDGDFKMLVAWLVSCFRPGLPIPILQINGEAGSAKTTALRICRKLVDPSNAEGRGLPGNEDDLIVAAHNNWIVSGDNISRVSPDLADALCRLATGGGLSKRKLYTDNTEHCIDAKRPIALTGINVVSERPDLVGRTLPIRLGYIDETKRCTETKLDADFAEARPQILGALLDGVSMALRRVDDVKLVRLPRMADFAKWAEAAGPAFGWDEFEFIDAYSENRRNAMEQAVEADIVANTIRQWITDRGEEWAGFTADLLEILDAKVNQSVLDEKELKKFWPPDPTRLAKKLSRIAPALRTIGIGVSSENDRRLNKTVWTIAPKQKTQLEIGGL